MTILDRVRLLLGIEDEAQNALLTLLIDLVTDKVLQDLGQEHLPKPLESMVADLAADAYRLRQAARGGEEGIVASLSDNGQSVTYRDGSYTAVLQATASQNLKNYEPVLARWRKVGW